MRSLRIFISFVLVIIGVVSTIGSGNWNWGDGSGGGSGIHSLGPIGPQPNVDINNDNAEAVSATVVKAIGKLFDLMAVIGGQVFPRLVVAPDLLPGSSKYELIVSAAETGEEVADACTFSGTVTVSGLAWNDPQPMILSGGDTFYLIFDSCDDGDGYILDGAFTLSIAGLDGDPGTDVFRLSYNLHEDMALTVTSGMEMLFASVRVDTQLEWNSFDFPVVVLTTLPTSLELSTEAYFYGWVFSGDHIQSVSADISNPSKVTDAAYVPNLQSSILGGSISYDITVPLQTPDGQNPELGEILISGGKENGTVRVVIESSISVRLEIDSDGDGSVDDYQYTTWEALQN